MYKVWKEGKKKMERIEEKRVKRFLLLMPCYIEKEDINIGEKKQNEEISNRENNERKESIEKQLKC